METVKCEVCGMEIAKVDANEVGENSGVYVCDDCFEKECVKCNRCGDIVFYDDAYNTRYGYLCECCNDDLYM